MILPSFETGLLPVGEGGVKPYVSLGDGPTSIVVVPGAADGLRRCIDIASSLAWFYRERAKTCRILILSRRDPIPPEFGVEKHADDMIATLEEFGCRSAFLECISGAGPIGQQIAVKRPDLVQGLILSSTFDHTTDQTRKVLRQWMEVAQQRTGLDALFEMVEQKFRPPPEVVLQIGGLDAPTASTPRSPDRLTKILLELMETDQRALLSRITCPTLVICGENDRIVPGTVHREMAARLPRGKLVVCPDFGHFNDTDNPAYEDLLQDFVRETEAGRAAV
jgi:pimeloyl-ACP methyl ester carboxylesterase